MELSGGYPHALEFPLLHHITDPMTHVGCLQTCCLDHGFWHGDLSMCFSHHHIPARPVGHNFRPLCLNAWLLSGTVGYFLGYLESKVEIMYGLHWDHCDGDFT